MIKTLVIASVSCAWLTTAIATVIVIRGGTAKQRAQEQRDYADAVWARRHFESLTNPAFNRVMVELDRELPTWHSLEQYYQDKEDA